jgi:hypothetical protein
MGGAIPKVKDEARIEFSPKFWEFHGLMGQGT